KPFQSWPSSHPYVTYELIPNRERKLIKKLCEELPVEEEEESIIEIESPSAMNRFAAGLVAAKGLAVLDGIKRRRVNGRLCQMICKYCRTPIMRGFVVNGHKVNRNKEFCDDACAINFKRHRRHLGDM